MKRLLMGLLPCIGVALFVLIAGCSQDSIVGEDLALETQDMAATAATASKIPDCDDDDPDPPPECDDGAPPNPPSLDYKSGVYIGRSGKIWVWSRSAVPVTYYKLGTGYTTTLDGATVASKSMTYRNNTRIKLRSQGFTRPSGSHTWKQTGSHFFQYLSSSQSYVRGSSKTFSHN